MGDIIKAAADVVDAIATALEDGWQPVEDIPQIVVVAIRDFAPIIQKYLNLLKP